MPPAYVKAYVKRNKNDAADAEAICEAVTRPSMRFVPVKDAEQQSVLMLHRARSLLVRQRTMLVNALRAHMAEFGIIAPQGLRTCRDLDQDNCSSTRAAPRARALDPADDRGPAERHDRQGPGDRGAPGQVASAKPGQSFAGDRAGCRHHGRERDCRDGYRSLLVPIRPRVRRLAGDDATAELQRRQGTAWAAPASAATNTSAACSSPARLRCCAMPAIDQPATASGFALCWRANRPNLLRSHWPTRPPASSGR